jgi:hypothetical protein
MCTYLTMDELKKFTSVNDTEVNDLLQKVRENFDGKFLLETRNYKRKRTFFSSWLSNEPQETTLYTLYYDLLGGEVQVINFASDNTESSIHTHVTKATIMNYFMGMLNGFKYFQIKETIPHE